VVILQAPLVTPDLPFKPVDCFVECPVSVGSRTFRFEDNARIEVRCAIRAKPRTFVRKHDTRFRSAIEEFANHGFKTFSNHFGKNVANVELFA
jgi:hypothetical protein